MRYKQLLSMSVLLCSCVADSNAALGESCSRQSDCTDPMTFCKTWEHSATCFQKSALNSTCTTDEECKTTGAKCLNQHCTCEATSFHDFQTDTCVQNVDIATSQNDVRFVNIEGLGNIRINVQLSDNQSIAYIRLYINDAIENQTIIMVGPSQVEVMSCNSTYCAHETFLTTGPNRHLSQVGENYSLELNSSTTILLQSGRFTKLALMSIAGNASFKNVPQKDIVPQFVNNPKEQIEFVNVMFQLTTPLINQSEGSPPTTAPRDGYPVLAPLVQKYSNSLSKAMPGASNEECLTDCYCPCAWVAEPKNYTQNEIQTMVAAIQEKLKVSLKNLTSTYRKLNSMPDNRPSAKAVGVVGMIFLVLTLGTIFVVDIGNIIRDLKTLCDNLRQGFGCKEASPKPSRVASPHDTVEQCTSV